MKFGSLKVLVLTIILSQLLVNVANSSPSISNLKLMTPGCYKYIDSLVTEADNSGRLQSSNLPTAYLGNSVTKVDCNTEHHLEIAQKSRTPVKASFYYSSVLIRSKCLVQNNKIANSEHITHSSQLYSNIWRVGRYDYFICGIAAKSEPHPSQPQYKIYEVFYSSVLNLSKVNG